MITMKEFSQLHRQILTLCAEDHLGLWFAMTPVENVFEKANSDEIRRRTLEILYDLLKLDLIQAGFPAEDGRSFKTWGLSPDETIQRINQEWDVLGRDPTIGEIVWFTTTEMGDKVAKEMVT